ncbi:MAG: hypothetical protein QM767_01685 [Anaeromyxobacter sp.]
MNGAVPLRNMGRLGGFTWSCWSSCTTPFPSTTCSGGPEKDGACCPITSSPRVPNGKRETRAEVKAGDAPGPAWATRTSSVWRTCVSPASSMPGPKTSDGLLGSSPSGARHSE